MNAVPRRRFPTRTSRFRDELSTFADSQVLDFSNRKLSDTDMQQFACAHNVRVLNLAGNSITDAGLMHLKDVSSLVMLYLMDTQVTEQGLAELQKYLPNCGIIA
jgi:hypothetical protein